MTATKNPRVTITPTAFRALSVQAALESKLTGELASEIILDYTQAAQKAISSLQTSQGERKETIKGEDQKIKEDLNVYQKKQKQGNSIFSYWQAKWTEKGKIKTAYLGSINKLNREEAWKKARDLKAQSQSKGRDHPQ